MSLRDSARPSSPRGCRPAGGRGTIRPLGTKPRGTKKRTRFRLATWVLATGLLGALPGGTLLAQSGESGPGAAATAAQPVPRDAFHWLSEMNRAAAVMVTEEGIVPRELGRTIAHAVARVIEDEARPGARRSGDYLQVEPLLIAVGGPDVSRLHSGRSRQDIGATSRRLFQRDQLLSTLDALHDARTALLDFAARHPDDIVPGYTVGVQAQPISFGHYILGYTAVLERNTARLQQAWSSVNQSPLGSAALGTSSFAVNRERLAALLGFDGVIENSFDANQLAPIDTGVELVSLASSIALSVGQLIADVEAQYRMTTPWLLLEEGELTGTSSIMPQKRNPNALHAVRVAASGVLGTATTYFFKAHNVPHGLSDYKGTEPIDALRETEEMLRNLSAVVRQLNFNAERSLAEVNADYATTGRIPSSSPPLPPVSEPTRLSATTDHPQPTWRGTPSGTSPPSGTGGGGMP